MSPWSSIVAIGLIIPSVWYTFADFILDHVGVPARARTRSSLSDRDDRR